MIFGLLGKNISHSFSPGYFNDKFKRENINAEYKLFDLDNVEDILHVIEVNPGLKGFNVTIPYKTEIKKYLDEIDDSAKSVGAVNVVKIFRREDGYILKGFNTDIIGFKKSLQPLLKDKSDVKALVLGTGGASKAVEYVLKELGIPSLFVSRRKKDGVLTYDELNRDIIKNHKLIVNTTPVGMYPDVDIAPGIPFEHISSSHVLYDLIYNPVETLFLKKGKERGAIVKNGLEMLHLQAEAAWKIWNDLRTA